ncbi:hypothetical protein M6B38_302005 [Iris pallida]|uniref:Uncharacterized protein n=1 Tax=Iris pallida TaxID=29817 RepID=A0AAX6HQK8_IRIPA|nr:hypothetical protein M6B38_223220 [Iris pallida]KAJ6842575.1 hypothetical protein M6B38_302005 [Iris pallida]
MASTSFDGSDRRRWSIWCSTRIGRRRGCSIYLEHGGSGTEEATRTSGSAYFSIWHETRRVGSVLEEWYETRRSDGTTRLSFTASRSRGETMVPRLDLADLARSSHSGTAQVEQRCSKNSSDD